MQSPIFASQDSWGSEKRFADASRNRDLSSGLSCEPKKPPIQILPLPWLCSNGHRQGVLVIINNNNTFSSINNAKMFGAGRVLGRGLEEGSSTFRSPPSPLEFWHKAVGAITKWLPQIGGAKQNGRCRKTSKCHSLRLRRTLIEKGG